jgi:hypothetical protein
VGARWLKQAAYDLADTPQEFEALAEVDPILRDARREGRVVIG